MKAATDPSLQLGETHRAQLDELLARHLPDTEVWAYGSRTRGKARPWSDLDLVVFAGPEKKQAVAELREAFEESDLPFRVDLFVWDELPESFRQNIRDKHLVLSGRTPQHGEP